MSQQNCQIKSCRNFGKYCRLHSVLLKSDSEKLQDRAKKDVEKEKPIAKESAKRKEENKVYNKVKKKLKKQINRCQIALKGICTKGPLHPHHMKGRVGKNLTDARNLIMCCNACHTYIENHPAFAKAHGFSESRLKKEPTNHSQ